MIRLEPRKEASPAMAWLTPVLALILTLLAGGLLFAMLGKDPLRGLSIVFWEPLTTWFGVSELLVKASPLILIAIGLSLGFRANVWNIGAEGQFTIGALCGGAVALAFYPLGGFWLLPLMLVAGAAGGAAWAAIPAFCKTQFNASEILVSLMLTYVAIHLLSLLIDGPLRDPEGFNFPESRLFQAGAKVPLLIPGTRAHVGFLFALVAAFAAWWVLRWHLFGHQIKVTGSAPRAARFAGFSERRIVWTCLLVSGGLAGLAGTLEAAGPIGQLVPGLPVGYGFTAIIVAFLGRLHPFGVVLAGLLLALTYIGGDSAQIAFSLPSAVKSVFQGLLLFFLLTVDVLVNYQVRRTGRAASQQFAEN
jgi:general nucleoside transport system permease protein